MEKNNLLLELKKLMKDRIHLYKNNTNIKSNNIYISCSEKSSIDNNHCLNNKLLVPESVADEFYDILAMDIKNPTKFNLLSSISAGIFDSMDFIRRENEILDIFIEN